MADMQDKIVQDLKAAMLSKDVLRTSVLRSIKSAFIYAKVAPGSDGSDDLSDEAVMVILAKEAKKRQESADSFVQAGQPDRAEPELAEKAIINEYLPAQLSEQEVIAIVDETIAQFDEVSPKIMGQVIGQVKAKAGPSSDGALIARLVKERLTA
jgi:uncharacterized protein YqeY